MEKVIKDGKVAVLYSPGFGAGWVTWNSKPEILFHPKLVRMVEEGKQDQIDEDWMLSQLGLSDIYCGGAHDLKIAWLPQGTAFTVEEYDGSESIRTMDDLAFVA